MSQRSLRLCPQCGTQAGIPIVYGYPRTEMLEASQAGEIRLGGCIVTFDQPNFVCTSFHHRWRYPCLVQSQPAFTGRT